MNIRKLYDHEHPPIDLLLLADPSRQLVEQYLQDGHCFIAQSVNKTIGVYVLLPVQDEKIELVNIAVIEEEQGKGIGKRLLENAIRQAKQLGYKTLEVGTGNSSLAQLAFYQKCGFRIIGVVVDFFVNDYDEPIFENGIRCRDIIRLSLTLKEETPSH